MPRKRVPRVYFTKDTEDAIIAYNKTDDQTIKNKLYKDRIQMSFDKLAEIVYNKWKFSYFDDDPQDVMAEVVAFMVEKIHMYQEGKGKAFSYFTIVARNYLILNNNSNYKRYKDTDVMSSLPDNWDTENNWAEEVRNEEHRTFNDRMLQYWDVHLENFFQKKRDIQIADAVIELFKRRGDLENFNKKALYIMIREMTDVKTQHITKVVNTMKSHYLKISENYYQTGSFAGKKVDISSLF